MGPRRSIETVMTLAAASAILIMAWLVGCRTIIPPLHDERKVEEKKMYLPGEDPEQFGWTLTHDLVAPATALYDPDSDFIFVSNTGGPLTNTSGKGYISKISVNGRILDKEWEKGLNAPKNIRVVHGVMWVAGLDEVYGFKVRTTQKFHDHDLVMSVKIPGAQRLGGLDVLWNGDIFVTDMFANKIYQIHKHTVSVYAQGPQLENPSDLVIDKDKLVITGANLDVDGKPDLEKGPKKGHLYTYSMISKRRKDLHEEGLGMLDSVVLTADGNYLVSDRSKGTIYHVTPKGKVTVLVNIPGGFGQMSFSKDGKNLYVPSNADNYVRNYDYRTLIADAFHTERPTPTPKPTPKPSPTPEEEPSPTPYTLKQGPLMTPPPEPGEPPPAE